MWNVIRKRLLTTCKFTPVTCYLALPLVKYKLLHLLIDAKEAHVTCKFGLVTCKFGFVTCN